MRYLLSFLFVAACNGDSSTADGGSDANPTDATVDGATDGATDGGDTDAACLAFAAARCQKSDSCSQVTNEIVYGTTLSLQHCEARQKLTCLAALAAPGTGATPAFFQTCATAITAEACTAFENENLPPECVPAIGTRSDGTGCTFNAQCTSTWCHVPTGASCGQCAAVPQAGATCADDADCGARGMVCTTQGKCAARVTVGGACGPSLPCQVGFSCVTGGANPNTCQADGNTVGAACDPKRKANPLCAGLSQLFCAANDQCATYSLPSSSNGQPCGLIDLSDAGVAIDAGAPYSFGACTGSALCVNGGCIAPASDTGSCDTSAGPPCYPPARCVTGDAGTAGVCQLPGSVTCN